MLLILGFHLTFSVTVPGQARARRSPAPDYLRVMSFNIRYNTPRDNENAWPKRKELVASIIRFHQADLVGLQEALKDQLDDLQQLLPDYAWLGVGRDDGQLKGEFSAILYRKARLTPLEQATFWLSETPDTVGSKGWDAALPRIVTWAKFKDQRTNKSFFHFNTHFDHMGQQSRAESARLIREQVTKLAGRLPVVVTGDFNANEASAPYRVMLEAPPAGSAAPAWRDARDLSEHGNHGHTSTWNGFKQLEPNRKIDHIFVRGPIKVRQHGILSDTWDGRFPSDHFPVLAELVIE